jgi:uncharacterized membrane protein
MNYFTLQYVFGSTGQADEARDLLILRGVSTIFALVMAMIVQGAIVRATIANSEGRRAGFAESLMAGLRVAVPLVLLAILIGLSVLIGFIFLIVPGVMLYVIWSVASPALVEERVGVIGALRRSRYLTKGARWKIFGLELILLIAMWIVTAVLGFVMIASSGNVQAAALSLPGLSLGWLIGNAIAATLINAFWSTVQTSLYVDLRDWKDGPQGSHLENVFA